MQQSEGRLTRFCCAVCIAVVCVGVTGFGALSRVCAQSGTGTITGTVVEAADGKPLSEAGIEAVSVDGGRPMFALTNSEGFFVFELAPGVYNLKITYPNFETKYVKGVSVSAGAANDQKIRISPAPVEIDEMRVVAKPRGDVELVQLMKRRTAANIMDNISAETISKIPESDVAGILSRMPGVTINDGKFMQARGMPKRYNRSLLNGASLPTTKPNEKLVPLNIFPAGIVESINVIKSYSPELPGNFSGGLCRIQTKSMPDKFTLSLSSSLKYNTATTNRDFMTYRGGARDWLGYDDGTRDKPDIIPDTILKRRGLFSKDGFEPNELEAFGESFQNVWTPYSKNAPLNHDVSFLVGDRFNKFGYIFTISYKHDYQNRQQERQNIYVVDGEGLRRDKFYSFERSGQTMKLHGLFNIGFELSPNHIIKFNNFYSHTGEDEVLYYEGYHSDEDVYIQDTRLRWIEEEIYSGQLLGEHRFYALFDHKIDWRYNYSMSSMWEPDLREFEREENKLLNKYVFANEGMSGFHMWTLQKEDIHDLSINWRITFQQWSDLDSNFKFGAAYLERDREFWSRRFRFLPRDTSKIDMSLPMEELFSPENINPYEFEVQETTRATDTYDADQKIMSFYCLLELPLTSKIRLSGGSRFEDSEINSITYNLFQKESPPIVSSIDSEDWFPSVNITWTMIENMNMRLGYSETVSRPEFHELAPFEFTDVRGGGTLKGNPELQVAEIKNYDFRWEWFINDSDLIAVSLFYKDFDDAIEKTIQQGIELVKSFVNAESAELMGAEVELRKNLGFISPYLKYYNITGNYIYSDSEAELSPRQGFVPTDLKRRMVGQADHTYNVALEYSNPEWNFTGRIMFQHISDRISEAGGNLLPNIILEDSSRWDIVLIKRFANNFEAKLIAENITNEGQTYTQGGNIQHKYREGVTWKIKLSYKW